MEGYLVPLWKNGVHVGRTKGLGDPVRKGKDGGDREKYDLHG